MEWNRSAVQVEMDRFLLSNGMEMENCQLFEVQYCMSVNGIKRHGNKCGKIGQILHLNGRLAVSQSL